MEDSDKTTALKKAYAEIILNTAKESAARVMISDRNSARFHHDLCGTKEESLRLLVRLKQMIDAKTIEAKITSSNQHCLIDVLEAQLQEAEDIITDLRSELRWVRDRLEKARVNELQKIKVANMEEGTVSFAQNVDPEAVVGSLNPNLEVAATCLSVMGDTHLNRCSLHDEECVSDRLSVNTLKGCDTCTSELDVNIRNKKLELSRNGCTQRIHALERKRESSPPANAEGQRTNERGSEENLSLGKVNEYETGTWGNPRCLVLALRSRNAEVITKPSNALGIKKTSTSGKSRGRRKRRWGKRKATSVRSQNQLIKSCSFQSDLLYSKISVEKSDGKDSIETHLSVENEEVGALSASKRLEEHLQNKRNLYTDDISTIRKRKRSKNMENMGNISSPVERTYHLVKACQESNLVSVDVEAGENKADIPENGTRIKPLPRLDLGLTSIKSNVNSTLGSTSATAVVTVNATNRSTDKDLTSRKKDVLVKCEGEEDNVVPSTKMGSELSNLDSDSKVTAVASDQISESPRAYINRLVKYTFQRKRKKGSLTESDDKINPLIGKREVEKKECNAQDPIESTLSNEPPLETPRLADVATQLISLSEN